MKKKSYLLSILLCITCISNLFAEIITYPVPKELYYARHNDDFTVKVRQLGDNKWIDLYEYYVKIDPDTRSKASMVQFNFSGQIEIMVQKNNGNIQDALVRPLSKNIKPQIRKNTIFFTIDKPQKLSIEFDGDGLHNLHLFANAINTNIPNKNDSNVMYFGAGMHEPESKEIRIPSNTTVYLEDGAVLRARLICDSVENVNILGNGILLEPSNGITIDYSRNVLVDGITVVNPRYNTTTVGQSENVTIRNIKSFSDQGWGDGLDFYCSKDILVEDVFMRNSDDCIAIYGHRWNYYGNTDNITVRNSILWADIAHPINIGTHGDTSTEGEILQNIVFSNIDILEHDEDDQEYQGCMAINVGDNNLVKNVLFENIRVENIQEGQLFHLRVMYNEKYNTGSGRGIENITFRNITYTRQNENPSLIKGYNSERMVKNILFENIVINGKKVSALKDLNVDIDDYTKNIQIK